MEYTQQENQTLIKKKIYNNLLDKDLMSNFTTEYREQAKKHNKENSQSREMHKFYETVTVAGKARYLMPEKPENGIKMP